MKKELMNLSDFQNNKENPFAKQTIVQMGNYLATRQVAGKNDDERAVLQAYDENTGEMLGQTVFMRTKMVDTETFAKVYQAGFSAFADLKPSVMKVFQYIVSQLKPDNDRFFLFVEDIVEATGYSKMTVYRALGHLCSREIIARGRGETDYFINPMYVFNGNRVTFITNWINANVPDYKTNQKTLKGTIQLMQQQGYLPKQLDIPFDDDPPGEPLPFTDEEVEWYRQQYESKQK